jgi:hypothetical protein
VSASNGPAAPAAHRALTPLAEVLGDGTLLAEWQEAHPFLADGPCAAPPAAAYERGGGERGSYASTLAEAALAGLPPSDDAVRLSRMAAAAGRSLQVMPSAWPLSARLLAPVSPSFEYTHNSSF